MATDRLKFDLTGRRFGRLVAIRYAGVVGTAPSWYCRCDCGATKTVAGGNLRSGRVISCGCAHSEQLAARNFKHGNKSRKGDTPEYRAWRNMLARCLNPRTVGYKNYGGRGISVCAEWRTFEAFLRDMGKKPSPRHSLERKNTSGNYESSNCVWATKKEQVSNLRKNRFVEYRGERLIVAELSRRTGISGSTIYYRLNHGLPAL